MSKSKETKDQSFESIFKYYDSLEYRITFCKKDDKYSFIMKELSIISENVDLDDAYHDLIEKKRNYIRKIIELDLVDELPIPETKRRKNQLIIELKLFLLKTLIILFSFGLIVALAGALLINKISFLEEQIAPHISKLLEAFK